MNILFLSTWHPYPPDNGSKLRAYYLLQALAAQHDVSAVAFRPPFSDEPGCHDIAQSKHSVTAVSDDPFRYVNLSSRWARYLSPAPLAYRASAAMQDAVSSIAGRTAWDAVIAVQMPMAQYVLRVNAQARLIDVDTALTYQMRERYMAQTRPIARASTWVSWQKAYQYERRMLGRFQAAAVVSQAEATALQKMVKANRCNVTLISNGVDCSHNHPGLAAPQPGSLVYNGSLTYSANFEAMRWFLAEIYPRIKAQRPAVTLKITGSTKGADLARLALDDTVRLTGFVEDVRLPVTQSVLCVAPIRQGGGTRLKILEAMALGTPVVATAKGAEGLDVVDGEHLLLADDPETFARCTVELLDRPDRRERLAANARRLVEERYDWQAIGARFVDLVEETVRRGQDPITATRSTFP